MEISSRGKVLELRESRKDILQKVELQLRLKGSQGSPAVEMRSENIPGMRDSR